MQKTTVPKLVAALGCFAVPSLAQAGDWDFEINPYLWMPSVSSDLNIGLNPPVEGEGSFFDLLNGVFMVNGQARKDEWSIIGDFAYLNLKDELAQTSAGALAEWELSGTMTTIGAGYAVYETPTVRVEALGGFRWWDVNLDTRVLVFESEANRSWVDPLVGIRFEAPLGDSFEISGMANVGGFGVGSEYQWEAIAQIDWNINETLSLAAGYRHLYVDLEKSGLVWDMTLSGPFAQIGFSF